LKRVKTSAPSATTEHRAPLPELALIGIAAVWGLTFTMVQDAVNEIPVMTFLAYRFIPASLIVALIFRRELRQLSTVGWRAGSIMGAFLTSGYIFQTIGLQYTTASNAGFITGMFVVLTPLFGMIFLGQSAGWYAWVAAAISAFGLYLLSGVGGGDLLGDALVFGCACSFAFHILATDRAIKKHDIGALLAVQLGVAGFFSLLVAALAGDLAVPRGVTVWSALLVTSLVASALGFFVQTYAQQHAPPARTAVILASEPAFAGLFAFVIAGERFTAFDWTGAALILAAIVFVELATYFSASRPLPES
jgi:drug/metabolite transporter (DMT)-like permease